MLFVRVLLIFEMFQEQPLCVDYTANWNYCSTTMELGTVPTFLGKHLS